MIAKITRCFVRKYSDNGQVVAYAEWVDSKGRPGRTEGTPSWSSNSRRPSTVHFGAHMHALFARGRREGAPMQRERW